MEKSSENVKLTIYVAENGRSIDLDCPTSMSVQVLQDCLASLINVAQNDQLLLCDDTRLEPQRSLSSYNLPAEGRHIFLFNRSRLLADALPPAEENIQVRELVIPSPPTVTLTGHPLENTSDPALKALPSYERQFRFHFQKGNAIFTATHDRFEMCRQLLHEQQVQNMAISTAKSNMDYYYKIIAHSYSEFMKHFSRQQKEHTDILANFNRDLEHLKRCKLHPCLVSDSRVTLADCIDGVSLQKRVDVCANSYKQFTGKVTQLRSVFLDLQRNVQVLFQNVPSVDTQKLERSITEHAFIVEEEKSIMQSLSKDVNTVRKLVDECLSSNISISVRPHDAVSALGPMYHVHVNNHLPKMEVCYQRVVKLLESFKVSKREMSACVHTSMQKVATLQSRIRDVRNQIAAFKEAMAHQDEIFGELKVVRRIGPSYRACLAEIVRRKASMKLYMGQAGQLAERMAKSREAELARREEFIRVHGGFIPREVIASLGLLGIPSQCVVNIEPYDTDLCDIDMVDLEKFAPELLFGPHLKIARSKSEQIEDSVSTITDQIIEDGMNDEISGTSKMEVENAWLKAELASRIAVLCSYDQCFDILPVSETNDPSAGNQVTRKTLEALALKDDYAKHLQTILTESQQQCSSYERRIRELEQRLTDQHDQMRRLNSNDSMNHSTAQLVITETSSKSETSGVTEDVRITNMGATPLGAMDDHDGACNSHLIDFGRSLSINGRAEKFEEGVDESMVEFSTPISGGDAAMSDEREEIQLDLTKEGKSDMEKKGIEHFDRDCRACTHGKEGKDRDFVSLQNALLEKSKYCTALEEKLETAHRDIDLLRKEIQQKDGLLEECQFNCAELETALHNAREDTRITQCSADRKTAEYNALRISSVKLCGFVERLRQSVSISSSGGLGLADSLRSLANCLKSDAESEGAADFCECVKTLADKVGLLAKAQADLMERCSLIETSKSLLAAELESKLELLKNLYAKHNLDKQVNKEKICYTRFQVHELAIFSRNGSGYYEAMNRGCPNYYLSEESVDLFRQDSAQRQAYIVGQIVHIEKNIARMPPKTVMTGSTPELSSSVTITSANPYGLPVGTVYFIVTLAMLPDRMPSSRSLQGVDSG